MNDTPKAKQNLVAGLIGRGIQSSRTPYMQMTEAAAQGLRMVYQTIDVDVLPRGPSTLGELIRAAEVCGFCGVNFTYPFKVDVLAHLDILSDSARAVGAVNTVVFRDGQRFGHNTDMSGFAEGFRRGLGEVALNHVLLIGAGGAGGAVAHALAGFGVARLSITDSDDARADALAKSVMQSWPGTDAQGVTVADMADLSIDGIVNATPVGMAKHPGSAFPTERLRPEHWVADVVYFPLETALLSAARAIGCRVLPGSGMAVFQAVRAFELFTGRAADAERMQRSFETFQG